MGKQIFGETDGIRAKVGQWPLRPNALETIGEAIALKMQPKRFLIARDTRESGLWIMEALKAGLSKKNVEIVDLGVIPTPTLSKLIKDGGYDGGIMVTASHNPTTDNGVKLFANDGEKVSDELELEIEAQYFDMALGEDLEPKAVEYVEMGVDAESVEKYVEMASSALSEGKNWRGTGAILLDAAAGAGHSFSNAVFADFGLGVENIDPMPNGNNINDSFGALHPDKLAKICKQKNMMGVALDGDADRCVLADEEGHIWTGDRIVAGLALYLKEKGELKNDAVVLTEYSNLSTVKYLESKGIRVEKVVNGDRAVAQKCLEIGAILGGENAGHIIYCPWLQSSDGTFISLLMRHIMEEKNCRLADLWPEYEDFPSAQIAVMVREKKPLNELAEWNKIVAASEKAMEGRGRIFTRYSGTEMKLRILVEGPEMRENQDIADRLAGIVEKEIGAND